jgi:FKBP-type peptidyl-prolyl cis-trans isomerase 2
MRSTHDKELVQPRVRIEDVKKPKVIVNYNSMMAGVDMSDAFVVSYHSTREGLKKYYQTHFRHLIGSCCLIRICFMKKNRVHIYKVGVPVQACREFYIELTQN